MPSMGSEGLLKLELTTWEADVRLNKNNQIPTEKSSLFISGMNSV